LEMVDNIQFDLIIKKNQIRWFESFFGVPWYLKRDEKEDVYYQAK